MITSKTTADRQILDAARAGGRSDGRSKPFYVGGGFYVVKAMVGEARISESFEKGGGMLWGEHDSDRSSVPRNSFGPVTRRI